MNSKAFFGTIIWIILVFLIVSGFIFYNTLKGKIWDSKSFFNNKKENNMNSEDEIEVITVPNSSVERLNTTS